MANKKQKQDIYTWQEFFADVGTMESYIKKGKFSFANIYGVPRGGLILGTILSHKLGLPLILDASKVSKRTLVVDDMSDSGGTFVRLLKKIKTPASIMTLWCSPTAKVIPDYYVRTKTANWIILPWETKESSKYDKTKI